MICIRDRVRFVETDTMGVVHHSKYLYWFEMGRAALLRAGGYSLNDLMDAGILFPIAEVEVKYKNSCKYDDEYEVQTTCTAVTKIKLEFEQKVIRLSDGAVAAEGKVRNVFTDKDGKIARIDNEWFNRLKPMMEL
ncbi:MAG: acyl-CoA thioesterase [Phascolarctobacterium sp.]|nr:acyl-CoA thioesterase [Phascolarctobacterium sp.]